MMRGLTSLLAILLVASAPARAEDAEHHLLIHVDSPAAEVMVEALHNATNVVDAMRQQGSTIAVEIVANGPGTAMFIDALSPVGDAVRRIHAAYPDIVMSVCGISLAHTEASMKKPLSVMPAARIVPSGAVRIMQLEEQHWAYLKP